MKEAFSEHELTLSEYWRIIRKRKLTIISVFVAVVFGTFVFTKLQTPTYKSDLELRIEKQQPVIAIGTSESVTAIDTGSSSNLATEMRLLTSLPVMERVVERMEVLPNNPEERQKFLYAKSRAYQSQVAVTQIRDTNILKITVTSSDPERASLMATAIADVYIVENVEGRKKQSKALMEYIEEQLVEYKNQLEQEELRLQKFNQNEKVFEVTPEVKSTLDRLTVGETFEFETQMLAIDGDLKNLNGYLDEQGDVFDAELFRQLVSDNFLFIGLKRRLLELEFERFLLLIDYTEKHPSVVAKDSHIDEIKEKIVNMMKGYSEESFSLEQEAYLTLLVKRIFLENRREVLYRIVNRFYGDSGSLSSNQLEYLGLKRNVDRLLNAYDSLILQRDEVRLNLAKVIDDVVTIVSPSAVPEKPISPTLRVNLLVSTAVGLLLGLLLSFFQESVDSSVSSIADVENEIKIKMLGIIPHMKREDVLVGHEEEYEFQDKKLFYQQRRLVTIMQPKSWPAESFKMLRTNLIKRMKEHNYKTILFTSSDKQEGKSTVVTNIALSMAQLGKKTVLVGSNMRRPTAYKIFGLKREPGLSDVLMGNAKWKEVINNATDLLIGGLDIDKLLQMPGIDNLRILTCGRPVDNVSELLNSKAYDQLLSELKENFDVIIVDCSPVMAVPDAMTLSDKMDGVVLIYKVGETGKDVLKMAKNNLENANANLLGLVLNNIKTDAEVGYSAYYYRYYSEAADQKGSFLNKWKMQINQHRRKKDKSSHHA